MASRGSAEGRVSPDPEAVRGVPSRGRKARRLLRLVILAGCVLLVIGFGIGLAVGVSVVATAILFAGLLLAAGASVAYRMVFWGEVYAKDRVPQSSQGQKR